MLRTRRAHRFEVLTPRHQTIHALAVLADSGEVELETQPKINPKIDLSTLRQQVADFYRRTDPYRVYLPGGQMCTTALERTPEQLARETLTTLERWIAAIGPLVQQKTTLEHERNNLRLLDECLEASERKGYDLSLLAHPGGVLYKDLFACPVGVHLGQRLENVLEDVIEGSRHRFLAVAGLPEQIEPVRSVTDAHGCVPVTIPHWLPADAQTWRAAIADRLDTIALETDVTRRRIESVRTDTGMKDAVCNSALLKWYVDQAPAVDTGETHCHIVGWTPDASPRSLHDRLKNAGIDAIVRFTSMPLAPEAPVTTEDSWWARPFAVFMQMYGAPEQREVDPSALMAFVVPLLFGYMFPDVGHGLVLVLISIALYRRWPAGRFLIPCGAVSMAFGVLFGEVFGFEGLIQPLWLRPLDEPLTVLTVPLLFGVALITTGLLLAGLQASWQRQLLHWALTDAAIVVLYLSCLISVFVPAWLNVIPWILAWYFTGSLIQAPTPFWRHLVGTAGHLLESTFQLLINTLSFIRVGAFALAHAGVSSALVQILDMVGDPVAYAIVFVLGQAFIITLEALVVFVQTTRLLFFEFFLRFVHAGGRAFRPLRRPGDGSDS